MSERPQGASGDATGDETRPITPPDPSPHDPSPHDPSPHDPSPHDPSPHEDPGHPSDRSSDQSSAEHVPTYAAPVPPATAAQEASTRGAPRQRWRDRLWGLRALIAVALASVIVGGLAGATLANVSNHDDGGNRFGPGAGRHGGFAPGQRRGFGNGGGNGFAPPGRQQGQQPGQQQGQRQQP